MRVIVRTGIGYVLFAGGLTFLVYGIAQAIENGSCGTDEYGNSVGPACPSGFGPMIALMILGTFVAIIGAAVAAVRLGVIARLVFAGIAAIVAGLVLGFVDVHADDTRPGTEILIAVLVPLALFSIPGRARVGAPMTVPPVTFATPPPGDVARERGRDRRAAAPARPAARLRAARRGRLQGTPQADPGGTVCGPPIFLVGLVAALGGSYAAFSAMRAVGPEDQSDDFGFGDAALISPGGGDLFESKNFALVVAALERELGADGKLSYLRVERTKATVTARVGDRSRHVEIDASGRSRSSDGEKADLGAVLPVSKLDAGAIAAGRAALAERAARSSRA